MDVVVRWVVAGTRRESRAAADALLRRTVAGVHDTPADHVRVGRRCPRCGSTAHGAPWARLVDGRSVAVSVTRTDAVLAVAVAGPELAAAGCAVGVDLEPASRPLAPGLDRVALSDVERSALDPVDHATLLRAWAVKEAVLKAAGTGLSTDLRDVLLERDADGSLTVARVVGAAAPWWTSELAGVPGHVGALALSSAAPDAGRPAHLRVRLDVAQG